MDVKKRKTTATSPEKGDSGKPTVADKQGGSLVRTVVIVLSVVAVLFVFYAYKPKSEPIVERYLGNLHDIVGKSPKAYGSIAIAYNVCLDLIVDGLAVLKGLGILNPPSEIVLHDKIT